MKKVFGGVVIHHTQTEDTSGLDFKDIKRYHIVEKGKRDIGYHFLIEKVEGEYIVIRGRRLLMDGAHTKGYNNYLGVALVGDFNKYSPTDTQYQLLALLIEELCSIYGIPYNKIYEHRELNDTDCPGKYFRKERVIEKLRYFGS